MSSKILNVLGAVALLFAAASPAKAAYYDNQLTSYNYFVQMSAQYYEAAAYYVSNTGSTYGYAEAANNSLTVAYAYNYCYNAGLSADMAYGYYAPSDYEQMKASAVQAAELADYGVKLYYSIY